MWRLQKKRITHTALGWNIDDQDCHLHFSCEIWRFASVFSAVLEVYLARGSGWNSGRDRCWVMTSAGTYIACPPAVDPENHVPSPQLWSRGCCVNLWPHFQTLAYFPGSCRPLKINYPQVHYSQKAQQHGEQACESVCPVRMELLQHYLAQKRFIIQHQKEEQTCRCVFFVFFCSLTSASASARKTLENILQLCREIKLFRSG